MDDFSAGDPARNTDYVYALAANTIKLGFENPSYAGTCYYVRVKFSALCGGSQGTLGVSLYDGAVQIGSEEIVSPPLSPAGYGEFNISFTTTKTAAELSDMRVWFRWISGLSNIVSSVQIDIILASSSSSSSSSCSSSQSFSSSSSSSCDESQWIRHFDNDATGWQCQANCTLPAWTVNGPGMEIRPNVAATWDNGYRPLQIRLTGTHNLGSGDWDFRLRDTGNNIIANIAIPPNPGGTSPPANIDWSNNLDLLRLQDLDAPSGQLTNIEFLVCSSSSSSSCSSSFSSCSSSFSSSSSSFSSSSSCSSSSSSFSSSSSCSSSSFSSSSSCSSSSFSSSSSSFSSSSSCSSSSSSFSSSSSSFSSSSSQSFQALQSIFIVPDSDVTTTRTFGSGSNNWDRINDGILGGTPDDTNGIYVIDGDEWRGGFVNPSFVGTCLEIKVHVRAKERISGFADFSTHLYSDGVTQDEWDFYTPTASYATYTLTPSPPIAKTAAQLTNLEVMVRGQSASNDAEVPEVEVEIVLTSSSSSSSCSSSFSSCSSSFSSSSSSSSSFSSSSSSSSSFSSSSSSFSSSSSSSFSSSSSESASVSLFVLPDGDVSGVMATFGSGSGRYDRLNDGIFSATPDDTNGVYGLEGDHTRVTIESPSFAGTCDNVLVHVRAKEFATGPVSMTTLLYSDGSALDDSDNTGVTSSYVNYTLTPSPKVQKTAAQLTNIEVRIQGEGASNDTQMSEIEVEIVLPSSSSSSSSSTST